MSHPNLNQHLFNQNGTMPYCFSDSLFPPDQKPGLSESISVGATRFTTDLDPVAYVRSRPPGYVPADEINHGEYKGEREDAFFKLENYCPYPISTTT